MLPRGQRIGQYSILRLLKKGGMGEVYLAEEQKLRRQVAIKVIWTDDSHYDDIEKAQDAIQLFQREAETLARFDNPYILPVFSSGEDDFQGATFMYLVMPYRPNGSLYDWLHTNNQHEQLSIWDIDRILQQAASALQHAHDLNIIHQDVKASNFLVQGQPDRMPFPSQIKLQLADFGIAKLITTTSKSQHIRGTPPSMAPEQWENHPVAATDQYALAIMIYELLTGRPPFTGTNREQLWHQHCHILPRPPSAFNPQVSKSIDTVILKALAKKPQERFPSVTTFAIEFRRAVLHDDHSRFPILTHRSHTTYSRVGEPVSPARLSTIERTVPAFPLPSPPPPDEPPEDFHHQPRWHWSNTLIILIAVLLLLGGSGIMIYLTWSSQQSAFINATVTAHITPTNTNQLTTSVGQTATASANQTSTAQAEAANNANATATQAFNLTQTAIAATATKIASENATATAWATITGGSLNLDDSLQTNNTSSNWDTGTGSPTDNNCSFTGQQYHATIQQTQHPIQPCFAQNTDFTNCTFQVSVTIVNGDQGGILFHGDGNAGSFYFFYIGSNGSFGLDIFNHYIYQSALRSGSSPVIYTNSQPNLLTVVVTGYTFQLYVNKSLLATVTDNQGNFSHGSIGVAAQSVGNPTDVAFSDAKVWQ